jgi:hypothetical protein
MNWVTSVPFVYPVLESAHIVGVALLIGSLVVFELRVWRFSRPLDLGALARLALPADPARRALPAQAAPVDAARIRSAARLPTRKDPVWELELAPLTRMEAWKVAEIKPGQPVAAIGYAFPGEKGEAVQRVEHLFADGKAYGLRSSPA